MVTMTVYVNTGGFCYIVNCLNNSFTFEFGKRTEASLKKTRKYPHEVQIPIQVIGQFVNKNMTTVGLFDLQRLNNQNKSVPN